MTKQERRERSDFSGARSSSRPLASWLRPMAGVRDHPPAGRLHRIQPARPLQPFRREGRHRERRGPPGVWRTKHDFAQRPQEGRFARRCAPSARGAYVEFARENPALYEAMFTLTVDLTFGQPETPGPLVAGFLELRQALAPFAGDRDAETLTEVFWSALHGLATLSRAGRLRPDFYDQRLAMLMDQLSTAPS